MSKQAFVAIIGDYNPTFPPHVATDQAIRHANVGDVKAQWIPTLQAEHNYQEIISRYQGFWIAPGSPYQSMKGALNIIRYARTHAIPVLGTCGGFQHMVIEFARNVLGIQDAQHAEYDPYSSKLVVNSLSCSLKGKRMEVSIINEDSLTKAIYGVDRVEEEYYCNFGLNPAYQDQIHEQGLQVVAVDSQGEARIIELSNHPFFIATLFVPQSSSTILKPHPIITAFLRYVHIASS